MWRIDYYGKRVIAWPLVLLGLMLSFCSEGCIRFGAWLCDVDPDDDDQYL